MSELQNVNLFKQIRKVFTRRKFVSFKKNEIWGIDFGDYSGSNNKTKGYILVAIDVHTRFVIGSFMKNKSIQEFDKTLKHLVEKHNMQLPHKVHSDYEKAITHSKYLKSNNVLVYHGSGHNPHVERVIQTIKGKIEQKRVINRRQKVVTVRKKNLFEKGYTKKWNETVHIIKEIHKSNVWTYKLDNNKSYYEQELQLLK